jgi:hypothetical protein
MKAILGIVGAIVLALLGYIGWNYYTLQQAVSSSVKDIVSESISKSGDTWHVSFVSRFDAPVDKVYEAMRQPERLHEYMPDNILKSELVKEEGNTKVVDVVARLDILPPGFKVQNLRTEFTAVPDEHRITSRSVDFKLADLAAEYKFEATPDGSGTVLRFTQTSKDKAPMLVDSLQKGALRENFVIQVRGAKRALGLTAPTEAKGEAG